MPLPVNGTPWPPRELRTITPQLAAWSAWYAGDTAGLEQAYAPQQRSAPRDRPAQYRGGIVGAVARTFWGAPRGDLTQPKAKLHVPVAADLCQASADLLFAEPPTLTVDEPTTQKRLDEISDDGLHTVLAENAEIGAALGSSYLRVTWDRTIADAPFLTSVHADAAWPEFAWGRLRAVTFWHLVRSDGTRVWRHLERHELGPDGVGVILHGLYEGTTDSLGRAIPLTESTATAALAPLVDEDSKISTLSPGLAVAHIRNQGPQRLWRNDPVGAHLGRSDLDGVEPLMDALDETYTSWMRDIRLGKARVFVAQSMMENLGPGQGSAWDADREVYAPLNVLLKSGESAGLPITPQQFAIRFAEHQATAQQLLGDILRTAGYSAQTFGETAEGGATTATEVTARERRSFMTRDRKIRQQRPALGAILEKLLAVDAAVFSSGITPARPDVDFGDSIQDSLQALATSAELLKRAGAASRETLVRIVHPDWDDKQVADEVAAIGAESAVADPFTALPAGA